MILRLVELALAAPATAQTMNAEEFHRRATALQKKGAMAVFSMGKVKALSAEARAAGRKARARFGSRPSPPESLRATARPRDCSP